MQFGNKDDVMSITPLWKGERFEDGRPKVPDKYLDKLSEMTLEELWKPIYVKGYENQFIAIQALHPEFKEDGTVNKKMVGRAVTAIYAPSRPDYHQAMMEIAKAQGFNGTPNQWVIDRLVNRDVIVIDMYDKVFKGTFLGGNLTTALKTHTVNGGAVVWGGIRDIEQMRLVPEVQVYYRGIDPTPIRDFVLTGLNVPARIGTGREAAICLPGDVVYGCSGGVLFIPPHLVIEVVDSGEKTQIKDLFGFEMIAANKFTTAQIDQHIWTVEMLDQLVEFIKNDSRGEPYRNIDWTEEYSLAENITPDNMQSAL